jgi:hypothetical protein
MFDNVFEYACFIRTSLVVAGALSPSIGPYNTNKNTLIWGFWSAGARAPPWGAPWVQAD